MAITKTKQIVMSKTADKRWKTVKKQANKVHDLVLIVVNYNGAFWLKQLLETLGKNYLKQTKYKVKVVVVDNGSSDDSERFLRHQSVAEVILTGRNLGFSGANNIALRENQNSRYLMLINSDIEFLEWPQSNLDKLIEYMDQHPKTGVMTPRLSLTNGELDPASHRGEPTPWAAISYFMGLEKLWPGVKFFSGYHQYYKDLDKIHQVEAVSGAAMMVRGSALGKIGLLDERFFMYAEDLDWARRFREGGWKVVFNPEANLIHYKNKSGIENDDAKVSKKTNIYFWNTMVQYYDKYYPKNWLFKFFLRGFVFVKKGGW